MDEYPYASTREGYSGDTPNGIRGTQLVSVAENKLQGRDMTTFTALLRKQGISKYQVLIKEGKRPVGWKQNLERN